MEEKIRLELISGSYLFQLSLKAGLPSKLDQAAQGCSSQISKISKDKIPISLGPSSSANHTHDKPVFPYVQLEFPLLEFLPATSYPCSLHL